MSAFGSSSTIFEMDEKCHNEYYRAIRSGNVDLLESLISKKSGDHSIKSQELEDILAEAYEELKLRNVPLTDKMELCVARKLLNLRFFESTLKENENVITFENIKERASLVNEYINKLVKEYSGVKEIDPKFIFIAKFIAQNIHILKQQVKPSYDSLPWEEIEFCLIAYVSSKNFNYEINCLTGCVLTNVKILKHLKNFSNCLEKYLQLNEHLYEAKNIKLPKSSRDRTVETIKKKEPSFGELYNDFELVRDMYSLETMKCYIDLAVTADHHEKEGQLVIIRTLQVIGEKLKNSCESPNLSTLTSDFLVILLPKNTKPILTGLRDSLSHSHSLLNRIKIEENPDVTLFSQLKNDIRTIGKTIYDVFITKKIFIIKEILNAIVRDENVDQIEGLAKIYNIDTMLKSLSQNNIDGDFEKLETLIEKLNEIVNDKTTSSYEMTLLSRTKIIIDDYKKDLPNLNTDYRQVLKNLSAFSEFNKGISPIKGEQIRKIKGWANSWLDILTPKIKVKSLSEILKLTDGIMKSLAEKNNYRTVIEVGPLIYQICQLINNKTKKVKWIEILKEKVNQDQKDRRSASDRSDFNNKVSNSILDNKLSLLKSFLKTNGLLENISMTENISDIKANKKLQAIIEMLMLDILELLNSSQQKINNNNLYFDNNSPLLIGKELRNHLAHGNFVNDLLTFEHGIIVILNALKVTDENFALDNITIGKLVIMNTLSLKKRFEKNLDIVSNQQKMLISIAEDNVEQFNSLVSRGADIFGRSYDLWTTLHYAAKGSNVEFVEFSIDKKIFTNAKDHFGRTVLHIASVYGKCDVVKSLLDEGSLGIDDVDNSGKTALHLAAKNGHNETVMILLENNARTDISDLMGLAPLHWAVQNNFKEVTETLLGKEKNVDSHKHAGGLTLLFIAAKEGHVELVNFLLARKANIYARNDRRNTPLHFAALFGHVEVIESLISNSDCKSACVNAKSLTGYTPLHNAVLSENTDAVKTLLANGADVSASSGQLKLLSLNCGQGQSKTKQFSSILDLDIPEVTGKTPLHLAVFKGKSDIVDILIKHECKLNDVLSTGDTVLHICAYYDYVDIVNRLLNVISNVDARNNDNRTPLHIAAFKGSTRVLETLISKSVNINYKDNYGMLALHYIAANGSENLVGMLIEKATDINAQDKYGMTPLHIAVTKNTIGVIQVLLNRGVDKHVTEDNGFTALHLAAMRGEQEIVKMLIENDLKINIRSKHGYTPLHIAVIGGHTTVMRCLLVKGTEIDILDEDYNSPLLYALNKDAVETAKLLIKKGAKLNNHTVRTAIVAVVLGHKNTVAYLLKNTKIAINQINNLLCLAAIHGRTSVGELLLEYGANKNSVFGNITTLDFAILFRHIKFVELLLNKGASVNKSRISYSLALDTNEMTRIFMNSSEEEKCYFKFNFHKIEIETSIELAVMNKDIEILKLLLQHTPESINAAHGFTILHLAAQVGSLEIVKYLRDKGINIHAKFEGWKTIHIAALCGHKKLFKYLLDYYVDINEINEYGFTLLIFAVFGRVTKLVAYLINNNIEIDVNLASNNICMPIQSACRMNCLDLVKLLLNNGAYYNAIVEDVTYKKEAASILEQTKRLFIAVNKGDSLEVKRCLNEGACINAKSIKANTVDETGFTSLHYATKYGHIDVVKVLLSKGAIYDAETSIRNTPLNFAKDQQIKDIMVLVIDSFIRIEKGDTKILDRLNKVEDMDTLKAVMNACNRERKSLIVAAILNNFQAVDKLINISQFDVSFDISKANELSSVGKYQEAFDVLNAVLKKRSSNYCPDNPAILDIRMRMAGALNGQLKYQEALDILGDIYIKWKYLLGKHQNYTLNTRRDYARTLFFLRRYKDSLKIYEKVYMRQKQMFSRNELDILITRNGMAAVLSKLDRCDEALQINYEVLNIYKQLVGKADRFYFNVQHNIAQNLRQQGKNEEALTVYEQVYEGRRTILSKFHRDTLEILCIKTCMSLEKNNECENLKVLTDIYEEQKNNLGPTHLDTLFIEENIASVLLSWGNKHEAFLKFTKILNHRMEILGQNHPLVLENRELIEKIDRVIFISDTPSFYSLDVLQNKLYNAASSGDETLVQILIDHGFEINAKDTDGRTPLFHAVDGGHVQIVELLLTHSVDITVVATNGNTPLYIAVSKGNIVIVNILLRHLKLAVGCRLPEFIDARTIDTGSTYLHIAAKCGSEEIVKSLLEYGATYNLLDYNRQTPLNIASGKNVINLLNLINDLFENARSGNENNSSRLITLKDDEYHCVIHARDVNGKTLV